MPQIIIHLSMTNKAFEEDSKAESSRILSKLAETIGKGRKPKELKDKNGEKCGNVDYFD